MRINEHVYRIGNDIVAAYLLISSDGITIIDAALPGHWRDLLQGLKATNKKIEDIKAVILTHGDSDHLGFAERLRSQYQVPVFIHRDDAERAKGKIKTKTTKQEKRLGPASKFLLYAGIKGGAKTRWLKEVIDIDRTQELALPGNPQIISLPGHSPGSIAVYSREADAVFVGDALTTRNVLTGDNKPQLGPFSDDLSTAKDSLQKLAHINAKWVLPGHGSPWQLGTQRLLCEMFKNPSYDKDLTL